MVQRRNMNFQDGSDFTVPAWAVGTYTMQVHQMRFVNKDLVTCSRKESKSIWGLLNVLVHLIIHGSQHLVWVSMKFWETSLGLGTGKIQPVSGLEVGVSAQWTPQVFPYAPSWFHWAQEIIRGVQCQKRRPCPMRKDVSEILNFYKIYLWFCI